MKLTLRGLTTLFPQPPGRPAQPRGGASQPADAERALRPVVGAASSPGSVTSRGSGGGPGPRGMALRSEQGHGPTSSRWDGGAEKAAACEGGPGGRGSWRQKQRWRSAGWVLGAAAGSGAARGEEAEVARGGCRTDPREPGGGSGRELRAPAFFLLERTGAPRAPRPGPPRPRHPSHPQTPGAAFPREDSSPELHSLSPA
ncbi:hypothetical protein P7K49_009502 [Saguinus oedipus]|uniref:Uncharacterized protein n=1 Tax=Saguinus oedipus TaxID=9490 RepID=A0ABQ9VK49_SAGOE|nr:hypothetical protein P7K49_009502 [Saguinus oedipus]